MAGKNLEQPSPHIDALVPDPVLASIGLDEPFLIIGRNLTEKLKLCATYNAVEVPYIDIYIDKNSTNSDKRLNVIVSPTNKTPIEARDIELEVSIKRANGTIGCSMGVLIVS